MARMSPDGTPADPLLKIGFRKGDNGKYLQATAEEQERFRLTTRDDWDQNPFSGKIILMDEVHNLVQPPSDYTAPQKKALDRLKVLLSTAKDSVIVGFTATPIISGTADLDELLRVLGGPKQNAIVSVFNSSPAELFARVKPDGVPNTHLPTVHEHSLKGIDKEEGTGKKDGNLSKYTKKHRELMAKVTEDSCVHGRRCTCKICIVRKLSQACNVCTPQYKHMKSALEAKPEFASTKFDAVAKAISNNSEKTLVICHKDNGFISLAMHLRNMLGKTCETWPPLDYENHKFVEQCSRQMSNCTPEQKCEKQWSQCNCVKCPCEDPGRPGYCRCIKCVYNSTGNARGEILRVLVIDAKSCSEGVSFFGVKQLHLVDMPTSWSNYVQRVGRAVRAFGHKDLPPGEREVEVHLHMATIPEEHLTGSKSVTSANNGEDTSASSPKVL